MTPAALAALHARAVDAAGRPWTEAEFAALLAGPGAFVLGDRRGFALGRVAADEAELLMLAVAPEARRAGLGAALVEGVAQAAAGLGAATLWLEVAATNAAALSLYHRQGFAATGRRRGYFRDAAGAVVDAVVMRRALAAAA